MSKKKPTKLTKSKSTVSKKKITLPKPKTYLIRDTVATENDAQYQKIFKILCAVLGVLLIILALGSGINGDDEYQNKYSESLVNYYYSIGADTSALYIEKGNMHLYGGFFDLTTGVVNETLGYNKFDPAYHKVRHIFNALFGLLAMLFTALLAKEIAGWRAGIVTLVLMFLSPRFLGHSMMNPKDIPFAAGFAVALYFMVLLLKRMPKLGWKVPLGLALGMALAISSRAGGLLLIAYLGLFMGIHFLMTYGIKGIFSEIKTVGKYAAYGLGISIVGFIIAILFWPFALVDPLSHPMEALTEFSKLGIKIRLLFQGENIMSDQTAWHYPITWIWRTIPLFTLFGVLGSFVFLPKLLKRYQILPILLCYFAMIFPVAYVIAKESIIHDGWRHLMFVYPPMVIIASLFWLQLEKLLKPNKIGTYALYGLLGIMVASTTLFIARNHHYPYVYFNLLSGGLDGAYGEYETDYWGVSVKQAIDWMEDEGILREDMEEITIATSYLHNVRAYLVNNYGGKVKTVYVRYNDRYSKKWDYAIFPSRYIRGPHLKNETWPTSKSIHTIYANDVPLTTIEKETSHFAYAGETALKQKDFNSAIAYFEQEVAAHPDNELAWIKLAVAKTNSRDFIGALAAADKALGVAPENINAVYYKAIANLNTGKRAEALVLFEEAIRIDSGFSAAYYYKAVILAESTDKAQLGEAVNTAIKAIEKNPKMKAAYDLAARLYEQLGDTGKATQLRKMMSKL
ncbi:MAG: tetratricopeptide (TPR) repeat protein [Paraglaciecola sp.]|jgi:tetratricopeptide (TPR) repeat protein